VVRERNNLKEILMDALVGKTVNIIIDRGDGRQFVLDDALIHTVTIHNTYKPYLTFELDAIAPYMRHEQSEISISGILEGEAEKLFSYKEDKEKINRSGLKHGEHYCGFCGSDWIPDSRGNCGACGGPKDRGKRNDKG